MRPRRRAAGRLRAGDADWTYWPPVAAPLSPARERAGCQGAVYPIRSVGWREAVVASCRAGSGGSTA